MREIKFRIWDEDNKAFNYFTLNDFEDTRQTIDGYEDYFHKDYLKDNPTYIQQFTGLKDKNGIEIYEGDKVRVSNKGYKVDVTVVVWGVKSHGWSLKCTILDGDVHSPKIKYYRLGNSNNIEVIGNIRENDK